MAHKNKDYKPEDILYPDQVIVDSELVHEMKNSYIEYAMSVIVARALPDVRDGLKPVHRRILYAMYEDGLTCDKQYRKCATAVGDVLGRYHPHGDASVYEALVRLAQDFSMRYPLVDGHGNFGSVDGDPPAAYRYTESRLTRMAEEMLRDIEKDTVDWDPNFDETRKEPRVLPSRFPNLLVNGSSGIAVGMATNIPPHNLGETIDACLHLLKHPDATIPELMQFIKGPDFPTRGIIMGRAGIRSAYMTGRGMITVRAKAEFEEYGAGRTRIIVTELPYQVNKRMLIANIAEQVKDKRLEGISDLRDETDRSGMRIVIELKRDANAQVVLNNLFTQTRMQSTFSVNMLALTENQSQPKVFNLKQMLDEYLTFQEEIIVRRTRYDLKRAQERAHLLEGLIIAQDNIDEVIHIIRESYDDAKQRLMERFSLSDLQAQAILDMRLKALQGLDREKLQNEYADLEAKIAYYNDLLASPEKIRGVLGDELSDIRNRFADDRKTEIADIFNEIDAEDLIPEKTCVITLTKYGYIKRMPADEYHAQKRGGRGVKGMTQREEDFVTDLFISSTHDNLLFFTTRGRAFRLKGYEIPESNRSAKGTNIVNLLSLDSGETVTAAIRLGEFDDEGFLCMVTKYGYIKRTEMSAFSKIRKTGLIAIRLDEGDELEFVRRTSGNDDLILATRNGRALRFSEDDVREMGRAARGVRSIRLLGDDSLVGFAAVREGETLLTVTESGLGRRSPFSDYPPHRRGGQGIINYHVERGGYVAGVKSVSPDDDVIMISDDGILIRTPSEQISLMSRTGKGVRVMRLDEGSHLVTLATIESEQKQDKELTDAENGENSVENVENPEAKKPGNENIEIDNDFAVLDDDNAETDTDPADIPADEEE